MISMALVILAMGVVAWVVHPLFRRQATEGEIAFREGGPLEQLTSEKDAALSAIRELDFDYETGKLSEEDYHDLRGQYRSKAIALLKEIDRVAKGGKTEDRIEREIRALRKTRRQASKAPKSSADQAFCPKCGTRNLASHKFCPSCGYKLGEGS